MVGKDALGARVAYIYRKGDALGEEGQVGGLFAALQLVVGKPGQSLGQGAVVRAQVPVPFPHIVECGVERILSEKRLVFYLGAGAHRLKWGPLADSGRPRKDCSVPRMRAPP